MHDLERMNMALTTYTFHHSDHQSDGSFDVCFCQTKIRGDLCSGVDLRLLVCDEVFGVSARRRTTHERKGYEPIGIPKKSTTISIFFATLLLCMVLPAKTAIAHDAPAIAPTRLDFLASQVPKNCNDKNAYISLLANWVLDDSLRIDGARLLTVRIRRSPKGEKLADVVLTDASGVTIGERHERHGVKTECHKVLYDAAYTAASLMGAFEKPPALEPLVCPSCPVCPAYTEPSRCPNLNLPSPRLLPPIQPRKIDDSKFISRRASVGAGVFLGTGITSDPAIGPQMIFGFVPSPHSPRIQIEMGGAWSRQTLQLSNGSGSLPVQIVPIFGALCYSRYVFRICSGLTTTFYQAAQNGSFPGNDELRITLAGHLRIGTEFDVAGPFSIRVDGFMLLRFAQRTFGTELAALDKQRAFGAGAAAMGVWSFD